MSNDELLDEVDAKLMVLKRRISLAALACLRASPDAAAQVAKALEALEAARHGLQPLYTDMVAPSADVGRDA